MGPYPIDVGSNPTPATDWILKREKQNTKLSFHDHTAVIFMVSRTRKYSIPYLSPISIWVVIP